MFYKHLKSPHPDVFRVSNDPNEGCSGIVMSCAMLSGIKSQIEKIQHSKGTIWCQCFGRDCCFHIHDISYAFIGLHLTVMM